MGNTTFGVDDDDLPLFYEDVLIQILVRLPVISLLRFKSVCKSWRALIETPFFIDLHTTFNSSSSSSMFGSLIFHVKHNKMFMLSSRSKSESVCGDGGNQDDIIINDQADYLGFPFSNDYLMFSLFNIHMVGSCNGIICIHDSRCDFNEPRRDVVSLWNPATRQFRLLPKPITIEQKVNFDFVAFGFDVKTKDYKVVMFRCFKRRPERWYSRIQVYSLSTDSWRLLEGIHDLPGVPCHATFQNQGIYMNGCYFFVGKDESQVWLDGGGKARVCNNSCIYSFDFTKEILTTIQSPDHDSRHDFVLTYLGDKMALFIVQQNIFFGGGSEFHDCGLDYEFYDIWVLNEQPGSNCARVVNKKSWTKLHSFRKLNKVKHHSQPRCISNNGDFALISTKRITCGTRELQLFNLVTGEAIKNFPFADDVIRGDVYNQSLVSIIGGNGAAAAAAAAATTADS